MPNTERPWYETAPEAESEQPSTTCTGCGGRCFDRRYKKCHVCRAKRKRKRPTKIVREDDVEGRYVEASEARGELCLKVKVLGRPGYPDRLVLRGAKPLADFLCSMGFSNDREFCAIKAVELLGQCLRFAELKKDASSRFQPKQKTILPMLRKRGFSVDVPHG